MKLLKGLDILKKTLTFSFGTQPFKIKHSQNINRSMQNCKQTHRKHDHVIAFITTRNSTGNNKYHSSPPHQSKHFLNTPVTGGGVFERSFPALAHQLLTAYMPYLTSIFGKLAYFLLNVLVDTGRCYRL